MQKILIGLLAVLCAGLVSAQTATEPAALLVYRVAEQGNSPYISRILVSGRYVRLDEGRNDGNYTLFDRKKRVIYNVSAADRNILVMDPRMVKIPPRPSLQLSEQDQLDAKAPKIAGIRPHNLTLSADGKLCNSLVVVPGLMPEAVQGLRELRQVLAKVQAASQLGGPGPAESACELAETLYAPNRRYDHGLPIAQHNDARRQLLVDFKADFPVEPSLFSLPRGFRRMALPGMPID